MSPKSGLGTLSHINNVFLRLAIGVVLHLGRITGAIVITTLRGTGSSAVGSVSHLALGLITVGSCHFLQALNLAGHGVRISDRHMKF